MPVIHPQLRKELEAFGAQFQKHETGEETVHIPGADAVWHFDPGLPITASIHPNRADDPGAASRIRHRVNQVRGAAPQLAVALMGLGESTQPVGDYRIHVHQYLQRLNGLHPVRQPYVVMSKPGELKSHGGYVNDRNGNLWASAIAHLEGEAPIQAVVDAMIEKYKLQRRGKPTKLAAHPRAHPQTGRFLHDPEEPAYVHTRSGPAVLTYEPIFRHHLDRETGQIEDHPSWEWVLMPGMDPDAREHYERHVGAARFNTLPVASQVAGRKLTPHQLGVLGLEGGSNPNEVHDRPNETTPEDFYALQRKTKLAAIGGPSAVVRVPVPQPVNPPQQQQPQQAPSSPPKVRGPVFILPN